MTNDPSGAASGNNSGKRPIDEKALQYIISLFKDGKDSSFIVSNMVDNGYGYDESYAVVRTIEQKIVTEQVRREKKNGPLTLILGLVILTAGIAITMSGSGVIAYGAIIVGALKTIQGLANLAG